MAGLDKACVCLSVDLQDKLFIYLMIFVFIVFFVPVFLHIHMFEVVYSSFVNGFLGCGLSFRFSRRNKIRKEYLGTGYCKSY